MWEINHIRCDLYAFSDGNLLSWRGRSWCLFFKQVYLLYFQSNIVAFMLCEWPSNKKTCTSVSLYLQFLITIEIILRKQQGSKVTKWKVSDSAHTHKAVHVKLVRTWCFLSFKQPSIRMVSIRIQYKWMGFNTNSVQSVPSTPK